MAVVVVLVTPRTARSQNSNDVFQAFFESVCEANLTGNRTGELAARCADTIEAGLGNISGDSEVSLNPSQFLAVNQAALARARSSGKQVQELLEKKRTERGESESASTSGFRSFSLSLQDDASDDGAMSSIAPEWGVSIQGTFENLDRDPTALERGFDADRTSTQIGFDHRTSNRGFVGFLLSYQVTDSEFDPFADQFNLPGDNFTPPVNEGNTDADSLSVTLYGSRDVGEKSWIDGSVGFGQTDYEFVRSAVFQEANRDIDQTDVDARAESDGQEVSAGIGIGYDRGRGAGSSGVYARLSYVKTEVDGFVETDDSGLEMQIGDQERESLVSTLGWRLSYAASTNWGVVVPHLRLEYEHEFEDDPQTVATQYVQDLAQTVFELTGDAPEADTGNVAAGLAIVAPRGLNLFLDVEVLVGNSLLDRNRVTFGLRKEL